MARRVDINADVGEGFALYSFGHDAAILRHASSANIACGWHAGDPSIMRATVDLAVSAGVALGAHVSYPDLMGFGRRRMVATPEEVYEWVLYQVGALSAFVEAAGARLQHVKPHGSLYYACAEDGETAEAVARATRALGDELIFVSMTAEAGAAAQRAGARFAPEAFVDMEYAEPDRLVRGGFSGEDEELVARRALSAVVAGEGTTRDGRTFAVDVRTICIHGHLPNAAANAQRVRQRLDEAGVRVVTLAEALRVDAEAA
jgi:5-oxoprolinase (ATP-hydrolysing) subunit A